MFSLRKKLESAVLRLVRLTTGIYALQANGDPSQNADFSLYWTDGTGGDPFGVGVSSWEIVFGVEAANYDPNDSDSFYEAIDSVCDSAKRNGIDVDGEAP